MSVRRSIPSGIHAELARYVDAAIRFRPRAGSPIRVACTLLTCREASLVMNRAGIGGETGGGYTFVNVHNPTCPFTFDARGRGWLCRADLEDHPAWGLTWQAAREICLALGARLPAESEWDAFASNNEPARLYPWGNDAPTGALANFAELRGGTTPVASFPQSDLGLFDLAGNLCEWCADAFDGDTAHAHPARAPIERVVKGGAWSKGANHLRIDARRGKWERLGTTTIGLRPVWDD